MLLIDNYYRFIEYIKDITAFDEDTPIGLGCLAVWTEGNKLRLKIGDGTTKFKDLPEVSGQTAINDTNLLELVNLKVTGDLEIAGNLVLGNFGCSDLVADKITLLGTPSKDTDVITKKYFDENKANVQLDNYYTKEQTEEYIKAVVKTDLLADLLNTSW